MPTTNDDLLAKFEEVCGELGDLRQAYGEEARKRDVRILTNRVLVAVVSAALAVAVWVGVVAIQDQNRTNRQTDAARITSCLNQNQQTRVDVAGIKSDQKTFVDLLFPPPRSPATQQRIDDGLKVYNAGVDAHHKLRDCSPAGVKKYLTETVPPSPTSAP